MGATSLTAEDHAALGALLTEFSWRVDNGQGDRIVDLFVEDGAAVTTPMFAVEGRDHIAAHFTERSARGDKLSSHHWTNLRITAGEDGEATLTAGIITFMGAPPAPRSGGMFVVGTSTDTVVRTPDGWRFRTRNLALTFQGRFEAADVGAPK